MSKKAFISSNIANSLVKADVSTAHFKQPINDDFAAIVDTLKNAGVETTSETATNTGIPTKSGNLEIG